jgi:signal transduction histidine kinase
VLTTREVTGLEVRGSARRVTFADGTFIDGHSVLLATGVSYRRLEARGLAELTGRGIYYGSALTEAAACQDQDVYVVGGANSAGVRTGLERDHVVVEIGDTGPGVPPEIRDRMFEPFFTTKPVGQGTGLGLDITWRIVVNRHHGDIEVESVPGSTRFRVLLPLSPAGTEPARA